MTRVLSDIGLNRWGIHSGKIFPYRHISLMPVFPASVLVFEWSCAILGSVLLVIKKERWGAILIAGSFLLSLSQMYQNQKVLILIVIATIAIQPVDPRKPGSVQFLKWQLILVYLFSAIEKMSDQFTSGETLRLIFHQVLNSSLIENSFLLKAMSIGVILSEIMIPIILLKRPYWGFCAVISLHLGFAFVLPDIWPFTLVMIALSTLFLLPAGSSLAFKFK